MCKQDNKRITFIYTQTHARTIINKLEEEKNRSWTHYILCAVLYRFSNSAEPLSLYFQFPDGTHTKCVDKSQVLPTLYLRTYEFVNIRSEPRCLGNNGVCPSQ